MLDRFNAERRHLIAALSASTVLPSLTFDANAQQAKLPKLVTVSGAITEVVYALNAQSQLVGTDTTSLYPPAALKTPKVGYMRALSAEGVLSLRPDAVIATTEAGPPVVFDQLRSAGIKIELVLSDYTWEDIARKVSAVGRAANREKEAAQLQGKLDAQWKSVRAKVDASRIHPRVLFILSNGGSPQVSGKKTAADALIGFAGGLNCVDGYNGYKPMTAEAMASAAPDIILTSDQSIEAHGGLDAFWKRPELTLTPAYKRRALVTMDALELLGFGPRFPATVETISKRIGVI